MRQFFDNFSLNINLNFWKDFYLNFNHQNWLILKFFFFIRLNFKPPLSISLRLSKMLNYKKLILLWRRSLSYRNQSIDLLCKSMDCFYMIETSVMKDLKWKRFPLWVKKIIERGLLLGPCKIYMMEFCMKIVNN